MHHELAAAAERHALDRRDGGHEAVLEALRGPLEERHHPLELVDPARLERLEGRLQVRADGERRLVPDDEAVEAGLRLVDGAVQAREHLRAERVHLALERDDRDAVALVPQAHALVLEDRRARARGLLPQHQLGEELPPVHRQRRARMHGVVGGGERPVRAVHAPAAVGHPARERRLRHRPAGGDVLGDPAGHLLPAGGLPQLEGPILQPKPHRMARSTSRAQCAISARCTAQ